MSIKCRVSINGSLTPVLCTFLHLPRNGDDVFLPDGNNAMMYTVERVEHWAQEANPEETEPFVVLWVSNLRH